MEKYKCNICPAEFKTQRGLDNHKHRWICPICGTKLKTAAGYDKHVKRHKTEAERKAQREQQAEETARQQKIKLQQQIEKLKEAGLFTLRFQPGDKVYLSTHRVTKPTHERRWNRMVRVRYEEERRYYADEFTVSGALEPENIFMIEKALRDNEPYPITYTTERGETFKEGKVFKTREEAEADAKKNMEEYKQACEHAAMCR